MDSWTRTIAVFILCVAITILLTVLEIYIDKKLRAHYLKKSAELEEEEKELRRRLQERQPH
mgnify:CR=1 FL=1